MVTSPPAIVGSLSNSLSYPGISLWWVKVPKLTGAYRFSPLKVSAADPLLEVNYSPVVPYRKQHKNGSVKSLL